MELKKFIKEELREKSKEFLKAKIRKLITDNAHNNYTWAFHYETVWLMDYFIVSKTLNYNSVFYKEIHNFYSISKADFELLIKEVVEEITNMEVVKVKIII